MDRGRVLFGSLLVAGVATGLSGTLVVVAAGIAFGPALQVAGGAALIAVGVHALRLGADYPFDSDLVLAVAVLGAALSVVVLALRVASL